MVQLLLPLWSNSGERFPKVLFDQVGDELMDRFAGLTAYMRTPASGLWEEKMGRQCTMKSSYMR